MPEPLVLIGRRELELTETMKLQVEKYRDSRQNLMIKSIDNLLIKSIFLSSEIYYGIQSLGLFFLSTSLRTGN